MPEKPAVADPKKDAPTKPDSGTQSKLGMKANKGDPAPEKMVRYRDALAKLNNLYASDIEQVRAVMSAVLVQSVKLEVNYQLAMDTIDTFLKLVVDKKLLSEEDFKSFTETMKKNVEEQSVKTKKYLLETLDKTIPTGYMHALKNFIKSGFDRVADDDKDEGGALDKKVEKPDHAAPPPDPKAESKKAEEPKPEAPKEKK